MDHRVVWFGLGGCDVRRMMAGRSLGKPSSYTRMRTNTRTMGYHGIPDFLLSSTPSFLHSPTPISKDAFWLDLPPQHKEKIPIDWETVTYCCSIHESRLRPRSLLFQPSFSYCPFVPTFHTDPYYYHQFLHPSHSLSRRSCFSFRIPHTSHLVFFLFIHLCRYFLSFVSTH